jgi:hypothetical protein
MHTGTSLVTRTHMKAVINAEFYFQVKLVDFGVSAQLDRTIGRR